MKSNVGIYEEYERSSAYLASYVVCCPDPKCKNHKKHLGSAKGLYKSKGLTPSNVAKRYECCKCGKTFRQIYLVNWITRECRRNGQMYLIATADNKSRYVFAADLNYDPSVEAADIQKDAEKVGGYRTDPPFRKHARLWLLKDLLKDNTPDQPEPIPKIAKLNWDDPEEREILAAYLQATNRNKDKPVDRPDLDRHQLPWTGMSVHNEYTISKNT